MSNLSAKSDNSELSESLARFLDGEPEPGDDDILIEAISNDAGFAEEFEKLLMIDELLRQRVADSDALVDAIRICIGDTEECEQFVQSVHQRIVPPRKFIRTRWIVGPLLLMSLFLVLYGLWPSQRRTDISKTPISIHENPANTPDFHAPNGAQLTESGPIWAAVVRKVIDVDWTDRSQALQVGEVMASRQIEIDSGWIELQMDRGALVRLEGPANLEVIGGMELSCLSGKLQVDVPPSAHGFVVRTPSVTVIDKGTSFAIDVGAETGTEVHLIKGMAELVSASDHVTRELLEGQSVGVNNGVFREIPPRTNGFPSAEILSARQKSAERHARDAWNRRREAISNDPDCLMYFDFDTIETLDTTLANLAVESKGITNGTIIGCGLVEGRWRGKGALEFKNAFDRLLVPLPVGCRTLSCIASVRLDAVTSPPASLLTLHDATQGTLRWLVGLGDGIESRGRLELTRQRPFGQKSRDSFVSKPLLRPEQLGTWVHLAFVWDSEQNVCRQYINGTLASTHQISADAGPNPLSEFPVHVVIGNGIIGAVQTDTIARHFSGRIDEFALFDRALSAQEIRIYQDLNAVVWSGESDDHRWNQRSNWTAGITPSERDFVVIDSAGDRQARYSEGISPNFSALRIGSTQGASGTLEITGGEVSAHANSDAHTRVGVAGGRGIVTQKEGTVSLNSLQLGLDLGSQGEYQLSGGELLILRGVPREIGSIDIGAKQGRGTFTISGGSLTTRGGVTLGRDQGIGEFTVIGSKPAGIHIGTHLNHDGFWLQNRGSTLRFIIDSKGVTPIFIDDVDDDGGGDVIFQPGALLDVRFSGEPHPGTWDVMKWEGNLQDNGLQFSSDVDQERWSFEFVDTDQSGTPDTLRVTAITPPQKSVTNVGGAVLDR